jgi:hypothetical protein
MKKEIDIKRLLKVLGSRTINPQPITENTTKEEDKEEKPKWLRRITH